jgi:hypothetical protein
VYTRSQIHDQIRKGFRDAIAPVIRRARRLARWAKAAKDDARDAICDVMDKHAPDALPDGPHDAFLNYKTFHVRHVHHKDADRYHLDRVKADLASVPGVTAVHQNTQPPIGDNWEKVYPESDYEFGSDSQGDGSQGVAKRYYPTGPVRKCLDSLGPTATAEEILRCTPGHR